MSQAMDRETPVGVALCGRVGNRGRHEPAACAASSGCSLLPYPPSTISKVPRRTAARGCPGRSARPARRYQRAQPGELLHVDTKKLGLQPTSTAKLARGPAPISRISRLRGPDT